MANAPIAKRCPRCGAELEIRGRGRREMLACVKPKCPHREPLPVHIVLDREGAPRLPGF